MPWMDGGGGVRTSQIEAVLAVAEAGSFSGAAQSLGVSQSCLSRSVAALEREVGAQLFRRPGGPAIPSAAGTAFLAAAPAVLSAVAAARAAVGAADDAATARSGARLAGSLLYRDRDATGP